MNIAGRDWDKAYFLQWMAACFLLGSPIRIQYSISFIGRGPLKTQQSKQGTIKSVNHKYWGLRYPVNLMCSCLKIYFIVTGFCFSFSLTFVFSLYTDSCILQGMADIISFFFKRLKMWFTAVASWRWRKLPVSFGCFERGGFKTHWAEVMVLAVVDVSHGLIL